MTWLAWRQFRGQAALAAVTTLAVVVVLVLTRDHISRVAGTEELTTGYKSLQLLGTALVGLPAFVGAFWGAPLIARELELGTHRLAWTQSVTRFRWLAVKLVVVGLVAMAVAGVFSLAFTWWALPFDRLGNRLGTANFGQRGIVPIAYALFALALGALLGAITKHTLPAMAATLTGFFLTRLFFQLLIRPHLLTPVVTTRPSAIYGGPEALSAARGSWILSSQVVDAAGHPISLQAVERAIAEACGVTSTRAENMACVNKLGIHDVLSVHPADHFWPLQSLEAAAFVALTLLLTVLCIWWIRHRTS